MSENQITEEEYNSWLLPSEALARATAVIGGRIHPPEGLIKKIQRGLIQTAARVAIETFRKRETARVPFFWIAAQQWENLPHPYYDHQIWRLPDVEIWTGADRFLSLNEVRFRTRDIDDWLNPLQAAKPPASKPPPTIPDKIPAFKEGTLDAYPLKPSKHPGGAPSKDIWEAVWIDIAARLINGDFDPKKQADIQTAIEDWAQTNNEPMGESTAKRHAKLLWQKVKQGP